MKGVRSVVGRWKSLSHSSVLLSKVLRIDYCFLEHFILRSGHWYLRSVSLKVAVRNQSNRSSSP